MICTPEEANHFQCRVVGLVVTQKSRGVSAQITGLVEVAPNFVGCAGPACMHWVWLPKGELPEPRGGCGMQPQKG